jgi:hypothetical protein
LTTFLYCISSHGFGHAARACAVIEALRERAPELRCEVVSGVPSWFFEHSLGRAVPHDPTVIDFGLVQSNALEEDTAGTVRMLRDWLPFSEERLGPLVRRMASPEVAAVVCDIAPLGIAAAERAGKPAILVENFTWDFIYRAYDHPTLKAAAHTLEALFERATERVQTTPCCRPRSAPPPVPPVARAPRLPRSEVRRRLGIPEGDPMVLVTMGGIEWDYSAIEARLAGTEGDGPWLVIPGGAAEPRTVGRLVRLPHRSEHYHPDLVHAADAVLGKLGYSTLAEVASAGIPFGYVPRPRFPESPPLEAWARENLACQRIPPELFADGEWPRVLEDVLGLERRPAVVADGAGRVAEVVLRHL